MTTRPKISNNKEMMKELAILIAENCLNESADEEDNIEDEDYEYSVLGRITKVLKYHYKDDALKLAKQLEDKGFDMDSQIVSELDSVSYWVSNIEKKYAKQWVIENKIEPKLEIGNEVKVPKTYKSDTATIVEIDRELAKYGVRTPEQKETSRWIISFETLEGLNQ